jgi:hypothetical protein
LQEIVSQRRQLGCRKCFFHGRHHLRPHFLIRLIGSLICCMQFGDRNFGTDFATKKSGTEVP